MFRIVRWIAFLPVAFAASLIAGALATFFASTFVRMNQWDLIDDPDFIAWLISGFVSGFTMVYVGTRIAPTVTTTVKWTLVAVMILFGLMSALGGLFAGHVQGFAGVGLVAAGIWAWRTPVYTLERDADRPVN